MYCIIKDAHGASTAAPYPFWKVVAGESFQNVGSHFGFGLKLIRKKTLRYVCKVAENLPKPLPRASPEPPKTLPRRYGGATLKRLFFSHVSARFLEGFGRPCWLHFGGQEGWKSEKSRFLFVF